MLTAAAASAFPGNAHATAQSRDGNCGSVEFKFRKRYIVDGNAEAGGAAERGGTQRGKENRQNAPTQKTKQNWGTLARGLRG